MKRLTLKQRLINKLRINQQGVTLVELMIVVLLIGILAVAVSPLSYSWIDSARITETMGIVEQATGQARAVALRNPTARSSNQPASMICNSNNTLTIVTPTTATPTLSCTTPPSTLWSSKLPTNTTLKTGANTWACACFTNKGLITQATACSACSASLELTIHSGNDHETLTLN
ncbi:MAG: prepilin-type N-terminal cleavage/methylation domain-containing protein [Marinagarivorans sp.]|nr:prepilin-type N-terminal cleavage/methylation domain-containing protein [Marinagarivorans sp.]